MGLLVRKPLIRVSDKVRFKPACSAKETSQKIKISLIASLDMILSSEQKTKLLVRLHNLEDRPTYVSVPPKRKLIFNYTLYYVSGGLQPVMCKDCITFGNSFTHLNIEDPDQMA